MAARDVVFIFVMLLALGLALFTMNFVFSTMIDSMVATDAVNSSASAVTSLEAVKLSLERFDWLVLAFFIGGVLALMVTGWLVGGHPVFMFVYFVVVVVAVIVGSVLGGVWDDVSTASVFGATVAEFPITNHLLTNLAVYAAIVGILGLVVMFAKPQGVDM